MPNLLINRQILLIRQYFILTNYVAKSLVINDFQTHPYRPSYIRVFIHFNAKKRLNAEQASHFNYMSSAKFKGTFL